MKRNSEKQESRHRNKVLSPPMGLYGETNQNPCSNKIKTKKPEG